ncbi:hypothetical protein Btru_061269 [Bulinus truncatus]|nr:hypothetical protein Btru_061269 [Bulinus truncatus]
MEHFPRRRRRPQNPYDYQPKHFVDDSIHQRISYEHISQSFRSRDYWEIPPLRRFDRYNDNHLVPYDLDLFYHRIFDQERAYDFYPDDNFHGLKNLDSSPRFIPALHIEPTPYFSGDHPLKEADHYSRSNGRFDSTTHRARNNWKNCIKSPSMKKPICRKYRNENYCQEFETFHPYTNKIQAVRSFDGSVFAKHHASKIPPLDDFTSFKPQEKPDCSSGPSIISQKLKQFRCQQTSRAPFKSGGIYSEIAAGGVDKEIRKSSFAKDLQKFTAKLKRFPEKENSIQTYENCLMSCHLPIKTFYIVTDVIQQNRKPCFSGVLYINDLFITRATSFNKKSLKHSVYESAIDLLKTKSFSELIAQVDPSINQDHNFDIHSANKNDETLQLKLSNLQEHIRKFQTENQPFTVLNLAFAESRCGLRHSFDYEAIQTERGVQMYTKAILFIEDQPFVNAIALTRKEAKMRACQKAITIFCQRDINMIIKEHFISQVPSDDIPKEIQELIKKHQEKKALLKQSLIPTEQEYEDLLDKMINDLKSPSKHGVNAIMTIDKNCLQLKMKLLTVYKRIHIAEESVNVTCDLYIVDRFIVQGTGPNRKIAQLNAYNKGVEILKNSTGRQVLTSFTKYDEVELKKPDVIDIVYKGYSKMHESNLCRLNRLKQPPENKRSITDMVIIEHEEWSTDRKKHSHCILNQSATQCGCLLEWITEPDNGCFRCTMKLQGEEISSSLAKQRKIAVGLASSIALFKLIETQPVVHRMRANFASLWCTRNDLIKLADNFLDEKSTVFTEIDKKLAKAIEIKLDAMLSYTTLEEFVTAPDWLPPEKKYLKNLSTSKGLRVLTEIYCEETLLVVSKKYDLIQIVDILKKQPHMSHGRYRLVPDEEKPSSNDILGELAANDSVVKEIVDSVKIVTQVQEHNAVEEDSDQHEEITLDSDSEAYITANTIFIQSPALNSDALKSSDVQVNVSEIPLPRSTSTPSRPHTRKEIVGQDQNNLNEQCNEVKTVFQLKPSWMNVVPKTDNFFCIPEKIQKYKTESTSLSNSFQSYIESSDEFQHTTIYGSPDSFVSVGLHQNFDVEAGQTHSISGNSKDWCNRLKNTVAHWQPGYQQHNDILKASVTQQKRSSHMTTYSTYSEM